MVRKLLTFALVLLIASAGTFAVFNVTWAQTRKGSGNGLSTNAGQSRIAVPIFGNRIEARKSQTQTMLDSLEAQRTELLQGSGSEHPEVKLLNAPQERLEAQLKAEVDSAATRKKLVPELSELKLKIERAERDASQSALLYRTTELFQTDEFIDEESRHTVRLKLQESIQEAFDLRMKLQNAQLDDAQSKIDASRQRLAKRKTLADQIVKRRVSELLELGETKRNVDPNEDAVESKTSDSSNPDRSEQKKRPEANEELTGYSTFEVASGLEGFFADIPELEGVWRLQNVYVDATNTPLDGSPSIRIDSNKMQISGLKAMFNDREDLRVYLVKGGKNQLLVWASNRQGKEFHLASFKIVGSQLKLAIQKSMCDLGLTYRLDEFPSIKPSSNVIYLECEAAIGLRSLDGPGAGESKRYFSVQNTLQEGETILEHSAGDLSQIGDANRIAALQGRWKANNISLDGDEIALADSFKLYLQNTHCLQFGTCILSHEYNKNVRIFAHPDKAGGFIVINSRGRGVPTAFVGSFSRQDATLRLAIQKLGADNQPPALGPGKGVLYAELREQDPVAIDPVQLRCIDSETTPENGTLHSFDARNSDQNTAYRITRLECDTPYRGHFQEASRLETQITLKPGEVRRIEVPVNNSDSDWRVWVRGGPADKITPDKWTPVIGFFANSKASSKGVSKTPTPLATETPQELNLQDLLLRDDGTTTHERLAKVLDQKEADEDARKQAFRFLNDVLTRNTDQANRLVASIAVWRLLGEAIYPLIVTTSAPKIAECDVVGDKAIALTEAVPLRDVQPGSGKTHVRVVVRLQKIEGEWLVVEVGLSEAAEDSPKQPLLPGVRVSNTHPLAAAGKNQPPISGYPYKLVLDDDKKTPLILMQRETNNAKSPAWKHWDAAKPAEKLQGHWRVKNAFGPTGKLKKVNNDQIRFDGFVAESDGELGFSEAYLIQHPEIVGTAILFKAGDLEHATFLRYSIAGDQLKFAVFPPRVPNLDIDALPPLQPGSGVTYVECEHISDPLTLDLIHTRIGENRRTAMQRIRVTNVSKHVVRVTTREQSRESSRGVSHSENRFTLAAGESKRIEIATLFPAKWQIKLRGVHGEESARDESLKPMVVGQLSRQDLDWPAEISVDTKSTEPGSAVDAYPLSMSLLETVDDSVAFQEAPALLRSFRISNRSDQMISVNGFACENGTPVHGDLALVTIPPNESRDVTIDLPLDYDSRWRVFLRGFPEPFDDGSKPKSTIVASYFDPRIAEGKRPKLVEEQAKD